MNEIIKVEVNENGEQAVSARELYEGLGIKKDFTNWFKQQAERINLIEGTDFTPFWAESTGGRPSMDYAVTLDIAKHLCMISGGEKAHQIREYFIQVERAWNSLEQVMARAIQIAQKRISNLQLVIEEQKPKVESYENFIEAKNSQDMNVVAKALGMGRNKLYDFLRSKKVLLSNNTPYQEYLDRGYFEVKEKPITMGNSTINKPQTYVTPKGVTYIENLLKRAV